jgi:1-acyl-sn-glycerol-3-phosphate acyltransferase
MNSPLMNNILKYLFFFLCVKPFVHIVLGISVKNAQNLPQKGPAILIANHNSHIDTLVLMCLFSTSQLLKVHPVAAADYFFNTKFRAFVSKMLIGAIAVKRVRAKNTTEDVLAEAKQSLKNGHILIIYPEGTRSLDGEIRGFQSGAAHLAKFNPDVPVVPIYINGPDKIMPKSDFLPVPFICDVYIGTPMYLGVDTKQEFTDKIYQEVLQLKQMHFEGRNQ